MFYKRNIVLFEDNFITVKPTLLWKLKTGVNCEAYVGDSLRYRSKGIGMHIVYQKDFSVIKTDDRPKILSLVACKAGSSQKENSGE